jgi:uncharacterized protein YggT (Ycf19 family)
MTFPGGGPLHLAISAFFLFLTISLFAQAILSWLPLRPDNPFVRFFTIVTGPILAPTRRVVPSMTVGMFDVGYTIAFLVAWWALTVISFLMTSALPAGW